MSRVDELRELTRVRVLLFLREPEAIFWVFVFPVVLAAVLGFAFRSGGVKPNTVAVVQAEGVAQLLEAFELDDHLEEMAASLERLGQGAFVFDFTDTHRSRRVGDRKLELAFVLAEQTASQGRLAGTRR